MTVAGDDSTKAALNDARTLMLGSQILFGFQLQAPFQNAFEALSETERAVELVLVPLMVGVIGLLIAPSARHRLVEQGGKSRELENFITGVSAAVIPLFALALAFDLFIAGTRIAGFVAGVLCGLVGFAATLAVCGALSGRWSMPRRVAVDKQDTPLDMRVQYVLTEARVILPGAQALLGFQLAILLTQGFMQLDGGERIVHGIAIACVALATAFLMAPAAQHRLIYGGENRPDFYRSANRHLLVASVFLAAGIAADAHVVAMKIAESRAVALAVSVVSAAMLFGLWHVWPLLARRHLGSAGRASAPRLENIAD